MLCLMQFDTIAQIILGRTLLAGIKFGSWAQNRHCENYICRFNFGGSLRDHHTYNIQVRNIGGFNFGGCKSKPPKCQNFRLYGIGYCQIAYPAEGAGCPLHECEKLHLRFIVFTTLSSATNILLIASIVVIAITLAIRRRKNQRDGDDVNERTESTAIYDEINLHPPSSTIIDTKENVAYGHKIFS